MIVAVIKQCFGSSSHCSKTVSEIIGINIGNTEKIISVFKLYDRMPRKPRGTLVENRTRINKKFWKADMR